MRELAPSLPPHKQDTEMDNQNDGEMMNDLLAENGVGEVTRTGWCAPEQMDFDEWVRIGNTFQAIGSSINWWVGDWLNYGEAKWGEMYAQAIEVTGWEYQRLANAKHVSERVQFYLRKENLSWTHHSYVASLPADEQAKWLTLAEEEGWTSRELKEVVTNEKRLPLESKGDERLLKKGGYVQRDARDGLPFSGSGPNNFCDEVEVEVIEYEQQEERWLGDEALPVLSFSAIEQVRGLVRAVNRGEWGAARVLAGELKWIE